MSKLLTAIFICVIATSCHVNMNKSVKGNGNLATEERKAGNFSKIKIRGGINVEVVQGPASLKVEADDNLLQYIETREENGWIIIKTRDNVNIRSNNKLKVYISTEQLSNVNIAGSGYVMGKSKFTGADKLDIDIAGSGDVTLDINTPRIDVDIRGSGSVSLSGETRDAFIDIAGSGNYHARDLLTENTDVEIAGSGDATIFADNTLDVDLLGSGTVYYKGKASVHSNAAGSGRVKPLQ